MAARMIILLLAMAAAAAAQDKKDETPVGIEEKLGQIVPLDLSFIDEEGRPVKLADLVNGPTVLTLVYLRCPSICGPLMNEVAQTVDKLDREAGRDFSLVTVSFDPADTPERAKKAKTNLLKSMSKPVAPGDWRFLTGKDDAIKALTDAVGFRYRKVNQDFVHAGTVVFLTGKGKIVRYLSGLKLLPADMKMALLDAAEGRPRSVMQRLQRLCYSYDPEGKTYVLNVNRIILAATLFFVAVFAVFLLALHKLSKPKKVKA